MKESTGDFTIIDVTLATHKGRESKSVW